MNNYQLLNGSNLAYIGDAYYELRVRMHLLNKGITKNAELRKVSIKYVSAVAHQKIFSKIKNELNAEEYTYFLRGRNNAPHGYRKNVNHVSYVVSTGLEAVIGFLYLKQDTDRLDELINKIFLIVESSEGE